jgi:hypothetical protein
MSVATIALGLRRCSQEGSHGITPHALGNVGEYEGMNLYTPK